MDRISRPSEHIAEIYERHALQWDADRNGRLWQDRGWLDRFIACLVPGASVLDLGCGSGMPVAHHLVHQGLHITGVDLSPTLIALCRQRMPQQEWMVSDMRTVALHRRFDGIVGWDSFFHLPPADQRAMFDVFAVHAAPGAFLLFNTGSHQGEIVGSYQGEPLYHASLDQAEYQQLLERSGFETVAHEVEDQAAGGRTVWLARSRRSS